MNHWSKALHNKTDSTEVFLFVSGKAYKVVEVTNDGLIAKVYRSKEKALKHYEKIAN